VVQVIYVVPHPDVGIKKTRHMPTAAVDCVHMSARTFINETDRVIHSFVCVAVRFYVSVCRPVVTDDCSAGFDRVKKEQPSA
jgi:hypothetical protein